MEQVSEVTFNKSLKNLKKIQNKIQSTNLNKYINAVKEDVLFLAMGGYNRTYELLLALGASTDEIAIFPHMNLTQNFVSETHGKRILLVKKINYTTRQRKYEEFNKKTLDLEVADDFEESTLIYEHANRHVDKKTEWQKPTIVILDDPTLNLQFEGYRFKYQTKIGFVQVRNANVNPDKIVKELIDVEEADKMMFARYDTNLVDEAQILEVLNKLRMNADLMMDGMYAYKPVQFKRIVGSKQMVNVLKGMDELGIVQLQANKKIGKENARWVLVPYHAFEFSGYELKDDDELFEEELRQEEEQEQLEIEAQEKQLEEILNIEFPLNIQQGYVGSKMGNVGTTSLNHFLQDIDAMEEEIKGIDALLLADSEEAYKQVKKTQLIYFLDGRFKDDERHNKNYQGGKRLLSIDVDEGNYSRWKIERKLEQQGYFGLVYPTAKFYYNQEKRWRIIMLAQEEMDKDSYAMTIERTAKKLELEFDAASKKIAQLMGYPFAREEVSIVFGKQVPVKKPMVQKERDKVIRLDEKKKSDKHLWDFDNKQAKLLKQALTFGFAEGSRNESYYQISKFLSDVLEGDEFAQWREEAAELLATVKEQALKNGLSEKEVELIFR